MKTVVASNSVSSSAVTITTTAPNNGVTIVPKSESDALQFQTPSSVAGSGGNGNKRPISLDLNKPKKQRLMGPGPLVVLESPDLQNMKTLNTPDLEKILLSSNLLQTPQPGLVFPTKVGPVTSEQEAFGKGFEDALHTLHKNSHVQIINNNNSNNNNTNANNVVNNTNVANVNTATTTNGTNVSGGSFTYANLDNFPVVVKDEPQNPSSSPPVSPIDMETQEKIKLERKRQRNRVAASKCRKRKLERISKLEDKVKILKGENVDLGQVVKNLKDHVAQLKQQVIDHIGSGCSIPTSYNGTALLQGK